MPIRQETTLTREVNVTRLEPLADYIFILANQYPVAITKKRLAELAGVTMAAVSKTRDRIYSICDLKALAYSKLVLRSDATTVGKVLSVFFFGPRLGRLLKSPYGKSLQKKWTMDIHGQLCKAIPEYSKIFSNEDALFVAGLVFRNIADSLNGLKVAGLAGLGKNDAQQMISYYVSAGMDRLGPNFRRYLKDENAMKRVLELRDRAWFLTLELVKTRLPLVFSRFLDTLSDQTTRDSYLKAYSELIAFYLRHFVFESITAEIRQAAKKAEIDFQDTYSVLGSFYTPEHGDLVNRVDLVATFREP